MAIIGIDLSAEKTHVSAFDPAKGSADETKFNYGSLDSRILGVLQDRATSIKVNTSAPEDDVDTQINSKAFQFEVCQFGLKGWENLKDRQGNDIKFATVKLNRGGKTYRVADPLVLAQVPGVVLEELSQVIMAANQLEENEGNA